MDGWHPSTVNGTGYGAWGKRDDFKEQSTGPEICWDPEGKAHPLSLIEMGEEEKRVRQKQLVEFRVVIADRTVGLSNVR